MIFRDYFLFDHPARLVIDRMRDILIGAVFAFLTGHRDKKPSGAVNDFQVANHETVIECDRDISLKFIFIDRKDPNFGNLHRDPQLRRARCLAGGYSRLS